MGNRKRSGLRQDRCLSFSQTGRCGSALAAVGSAGFRKRSLQFCIQPSASPAPTHIPIPRTLGLRVISASAKPLGREAPGSADVILRGCRGAVFHFQMPRRKGCLWPAICLHGRNLRISSRDGTRCPGFQKVVLDPIPVLATKLWSLTEPEGHLQN